LIAVGILGATTLLVNAGGASAAKSTNTSPIVVGGVWSAASYAGADAGAKAAFDAFNAAGGLDGRKIDFIGMQEDNQSPTQDIAAAKTLVNDHVLAVVPVMTQAWVAGKVLAQAGIPYFGWGISAGWWASNNGFSFDAAVAPTPSTSPVWANTKVLLCQTIPGTCKGKTVTLLSVNNTSGIESMQSDAAQWKQAGAKVVAQISSIPSPPAVVSDFSPYTDQMLSSNGGKAPDIIEQLLPPQDDVAIITALNHQGFKGTDFGFSLYDPRAVSVAKGSNTVVGQAPWEQSTAAVAQMTQRVKAASSTVVLGQPTEAGYISAEMLIAGLEKAGPSVTSTSLIKALNAGFTFSVPGLVGPQTFPAAHTLGGNCAAVASSNGSKYSITLPLTCVKRTKNPLYKP
jgi:branched-chain amino acid transport system substrate-binding protein